MLTLKAAVDVEIPKVKGSRFLAFAAPASDLDEVEDRVAAIRAAHRKATHVASAWRVGRQEGASDDGEVSGTAGPPALARLRGAGLGDVVVIVVRYFGGTLLGKGGLVRAYGQAAAAALAEAEVVEIEERVEVAIVAPLEVGAAVVQAIRRLGFESVEVRWERELHLRVSGPPEELARLEAGVRDASRGSAVLRASGESA